MDERVSCNQYLGQIARLMVEERETTAVSLLQRLSNGMNALLLWFSGFIMDISDSKKTSKASWLKGSVLSERMMFRGWRCGWRRDDQHVF